MKRILSASSSKSWTRTTLLGVGCPSAKLELNRALKTGDARIRTLDETCDSVPPQTRTTSPSGSMTLVLAMSRLSAYKEVKADEIISQIVAHGGLTSF